MQLYDYLFHSVIKVIPPNLNMKALYHKSIVLGNLFFSSQQIKLKIAENELNEEEKESYFSPQLNQ